LVLLWVGDAMNPAWVAALAVLVAVEKTAPGGQRNTPVLGGALIAPGHVKLALTAGLAA